MSPERKIFSIVTAISVILRRTLEGKRMMKASTLMILRVKIPLMVNILQMKAKKAADTKCNKLGKDNSSLSLFGEWQMVLQVVFHLQQTLE